MCRSRGRTSSCDTSNSAETIWRHSSVRKSALPDWHRVTASIYMGRVSGGPCVDRQRDLAVERLEEPNEPIDRLVVVGLVEKAIELRGRGPETANDLTARERTLRQPLLRLERQRVQQTVSEMIWVLVVVEDLLDVDAALTTRCECIGDCL